MTVEQRVQDLKEFYSLVHVLSDKQDHKVYHLRNKKSGKDIVLRSHTSSYAIYEELLKISHPNLPFVFDVLECDDGQIVLEEFIEGLTLAEVMECKKFSRREARKIAISICQALLTLHDRNLIHRDVKPENVMITNGGRVVLIDFNVTRKISHAGKDTVVMGTIGYASPEQMGLFESDCRTDIYALGILLNVVLTGKHPIEKIARGRYGRIIRKATSVNPNDRYQTVKKLLWVL